MTGPSLEHWLFLGGLVGIYAVFAFIRWLFFRPKGSKQEMTGHATVISKRVKMGKIHAKYTASWDYLVTFNLGNLELELYVTEQCFQELKEGMTGQLTWQFENLIRFEPDAA